MSKLTESTVLARTRAQDLRSVRKLNCWGSELNDVSIVRKMPNVEVLSLSVNQISTLEDLSECKNLQELYVRKNNICNLGEIRYLQNLPKLRNLWLADNPCAETAQYRSTVIRALPNLHKLDNLQVHSEEVDSASHQGIPLDSFEILSSSSQSTVETAITHEEVMTSRTQKSSMSSESTTTTTSHQTVSSQFSSQSWTIDLSSPLQSEVNEFPPLEIPPPRKATPSPPPAPEILQEEIPSIESPVLRTPSPELERSQPSQSKESVQENSSRSESEAGSFATVLLNSSECERVSPRCVFTNASSTRSHSRSDRITPLRMLPKGGKHRNSNILSAVLCLIKELDLASLEVIDTAIHCQMEEFAEEDQNTY